MPFYEYQCKSCGHYLEAMQKVSDAPLRKCPHCGKSQLQRLMSAPVFRLKGGGWYETDFKGDQDTKRNLADRPEGRDDKPAEAGKDGAATPEKAADAVPKEGAAKEAAPKEKPADKPAAAKEAPGGKSAPRPKPSARGKSPVKRTAKKPAPKVRRRR